PISDLQIEYSLLSRGIEKEILPAARELGVGVTAYGVLSRGLLSGHWTADRELNGDFRGISPRFQGDNLHRNLALAEALRGVAEANGATPAQAAIAWVASRGADVVPLVGARRRDRLAEALAAADLELSPGDLAAIEAAIPDGAAAGDRSAPPTLPALDTERRPPPERPAAAHPSGDVRGEPRVGAEHRLLRTGPRNLRVVRGVREPSGRRGAPRVPHLPRGARDDVGEGARQPGRGEPEVPRVERAEVHAGVVEPEHRAPAQRPGDHVDHLLRGGREPQPAQLAQGGRGPGRAAVPRGEVQPVLRGELPHLAALLGQHGLVGLLARRVAQQLGEEIEDEAHGGASLPVPGGGAQTEE